MGIFTVHCVTCGGRISRWSHYCPDCGGGSPKGKGQCSGCKAEIRLTAKFCGMCGADLSKSPVGLQDNRWVRTPEDFAIRVEAPDVQGLFIKPLIVEHGTRALIFQQGAFRGEVGGGRYDMGGLLKRVNNFLIDQAMVAVLMDAGDVTVDLENGKLPTADDFEVGSTERLVIRVSNHEAMFANLFKGRYRLTVEELESQLAGEVQMVLAGIVARHPAAELFENPAIRSEIEQELRSSLSVTLGRLGLELVQVRFISFVGEAYESLRRKRGELRVATAEGELAEQRTKLNQRLREALTQEKLQAFQSDKEFEKFVRQAEHEAGLKNVIRDDEMQRLKGRFVFERDRESLLRRIEIEGLTKDEARTRAWKDLLADEDRRDEQQQRDLDRKASGAQSELERQKIALEMSRLAHGEKLRQSEAEVHLRLATAAKALEIEKTKAVMGMEMLEKTKRLEREGAEHEASLEERRLTARSQATAAALISIVDGPAADRLVQLEKLRAQEKMSPEQILALAAEASPEAARALAQKYSVEGRVSGDRAEMLEKQIELQRQRETENADRLERLMQTAMTQMGAVAATRARPGEVQQTVVAGGYGPPTVVNPTPPRQT